MIKYELNLATWKSVIRTPMTENKDGQEVILIIDGQPQFDTEEVDYPLRKNLSDMLRSPGLFKDTADTAEGIHLGHKILEHGEDVLPVDDRQVDLLKSCLDRHLDAAYNQHTNFGGPTHEPLILRIYDLWKEKEENK